MKKTHYLIAAILAVVALITTLAYIYFFHNQNISANTSDWGSFGDYFSGIITGILTPVTVYLVWMTYTSQSKEFKELRQINQENTKLMGQQSFEQTFFSWMKSIKEIPPSSEISSASEDYYRYMEKQLNSSIYKNTSIKDGTTNLDMDALWGDDNGMQYSKKYAELKSNQYKWLETYMNALANFFQFIDNNNRNYPVTNNDKETYISILVSHFSDGEILLFAASVLWKEDVTTAELLLKYSVLKIDPDGIDMNLIIKKINNLLDELVEKDRAASNTN